MHHDKFGLLAGATPAQQPPQDALQSQSRNGTNSRVKTANASVGDTSKPGSTANSKITNQYLQPGMQKPGPNQKRLQSSSKQNIKLIENSNNFIHVQRIVPSGSFRHNEPGSSIINARTVQPQPVTQIVNVHNQFNISNNIIIDANTAGTITESTRAAGKPPTGGKKNKGRR